MTTIKVVEGQLILSYAILVCNMMLGVRAIGSEPRDLTVHPPPQNCRGWVHFFRIGV